MATTPEAVFDRIATVGAAVSGLSADGFQLENEQTPASAKHRTFRLIPIGWVAREDLGHKAGGATWQEHELIFRLSHAFRPQPGKQDAARAQAYTDALAVWRALESDTTLRALVPLSGQLVERQTGPYLTDSGDWIETDLLCRLVMQVSTS